MSQSYLLVVILSSCYATKRLNKCNQYGIQAKVKIAKSLKYQKVHSLARSSVYKRLPSCIELEKKYYQRSQWKFCAAIVNTLF